MTTKEKIDGWLANHGKEGKFDPYAIIKMQMELSKETRSEAFDLIMKLYCKDNDVDALIFLDKIYNTVFESH